MSAVQPGTPSDPTSAGGGLRARLRVERSGASCGALVHGVDFRTPLDADDVAALRSLWLEHQVLGFPEQDLTIPELERVAQYFGPFGEDPYIRALDGHPHVIEVKREADETSPIFAESWHSDWSFLPVPPAGTLLYGRVIPPVGGDTLFADQYAAYDALDDERKARLHGRFGVHSARRGYARAGAYGEKDTGRSMAIISSDDALATQLHPLVRHHPETGRPALFVSPGYTIGIDGMDDADAQPLLLSLFRHQADERFVYRHRWSEGLLTLWDNRCVVHCATGGYQGHRRLLHRITVAERMPVNG
jgi:taurine dioxygenase